MKGTNLQQGTYAIISVWGPRWAVDTKKGASKFRSPKAVSRYSVYTHPIQSSSIHTLAQNRSRSKKFLYPIRSTKPHSAYLQWNLESTDGIFWYIQNVASGHYLGLHIDEQVEYSVHLSEVKQRFAWHIRSYEGRQDQFVCV